MTATKLGLNGNPVKFLGAYVRQANFSLGLSSSPSTSNVTLVEDLNSSPQVLFSPPDLGSWNNLRIGSRFSFGGIVTRWEEDIANNPKQITVSMADPREIMKSVPMIIAPGFRGVVDGLGNTGCSILDIFGAYDDFENSGTNLSGWNQSGMEYEKIVLALSGGHLTVTGLTFPYKVVRLSANVFGETYIFNLDELSSKVSLEHRVNSNLISLGDFIQDLAQNNSFDWFVESQRLSNGNIEVTIKVIDRSVDNTDIGLQDFLNDRVDRVQVATSGVELRNEVACGVLLGAPVESINVVAIRGLSNEPIDLLSEGGIENYYMEEDEFRVVLGSQNTWESWVQQNGGFDRYSIGLAARPILSFGGDPTNPLGMNPDRVSLLDSTQDKATQGKIYQKLKGHAEATYGKRWLFSPLIDVDYIDAAWTLDAVAGNDDANEYFRSPEGKTRCYVEFREGTSITVPPATEGGVFFASFTVGKTKGQPEPLVLDTREFDASKFLIEADSSDYIVSRGSLFVAATIEEGKNIIKMDSPVLFDLPDTFSFEKTFTNDDTSEKETTTDGVSTTKNERSVRKAKSIWGTYSSFLQLHGEAYQPTYVYVPTRNKFSRYGPVFSSNITPSSQGKVDIIQDDGFSPWEFGSSQLMLDAMQFKIDNATSNVKEVQSADITVEGFPEFSIGESLGKNSNINSISVSFGNPVTTQYRLQSFLRKFGELSKQELALLSLYARRSGSRTFPQNSIEFINRSRLKIQKQFSGRGASSTSSNMGGAGSFE